MTERPRKPRASKRELRATAWVAGGLAFAAPFAALAASPKPDAGDGEAASRRPVRVVRHVTRRIVIVHAAPSQPDVTFVPAPSSPSTPATPPSSPPASSTGGFLMRRTTFRSMGTDVELVGPRHPRFAAAAAVVETTFRLQDERFSRFRAESELSHVNRHAGEPTEISPTFALVARLALEAAGRTDGAFDPTLLDAIVAAGYDRDLDEVLAGARVALRPGRPGGRWREIRLEGSTIAMPYEVGLDLGGLVKGWTSDVAAEAALGAGLPWALVNAGGDLRIAGDAPELEIAVEDPEDATASIGTLRLSDGAVATSSVTKRAWGEGLHHVIDPSTGAPTRGDALQATVWAPTCAEAEVLATVTILEGAAALDATTGLVVTRDGVVRTNLGTEVAA